MQHILSNPRFWHDATGQPCPTDVPVTADAVCHAHYTLAVGVSTLTDGLTHEQALEALRGRVPTASAVQQFRTWAVPHYFAALTDGLADALFGQPVRVLNGVRAAELGMPVTVCYALAPGGADLPAVVQTLYQVFVPLGFRWRLDTQHGQLYVSHPGDWRETVARQLAVATACSWAAGSACPLRRFGDHEGLVDEEHRQYALIVVGALTESDGANPCDACTSGRLHELAGFLATDQAHTRGRGTPKLTTADLAALDALDHDGGFIDRVVRQVWAAHARR